MENLISTKQLAFQLELDYQSILIRSRFLKLEPQKRYNTFFWNLEQQKAIRRCNTIGKKRRKFPKYSPLKLIVIDQYLNTNNNTRKALAESSGLTLVWVDKVLNEFWDNKCITVESEMNLIK